MFNKIFGYLKTKGSIKAKVNGIYLNTFQMISKLKNSKIHPRTFIDVGANRGMITKTVNYLYPHCNIYSFEPIKTCYEELKKLETTLSKITTFNCALSDRQGETEFYESEYDYSSSLLKMAKRHKTAFPYTENSNTYKVDVFTLDYFYDKMELNSPVVLKLDVQGAELKVLYGAQKTLNAIDYIMCEMSFQELYEGQPLVKDVFIYMDEIGFELFDIFELNRDPQNNELLQMDCLFKRVNN